MKTLNDFKKALKVGSVWSEFRYPARTYSNLIVENMWKTGVRFKRVDDGLLFDVTFPKTKNFRVSTNGAAQFRDQTGKPIVEYEFVDDKAKDTDVPNPWDTGTNKRCTACEERVLKVTQQKLESMLQNEAVNLHCIKGLEAQISDLKKINALKDAVVNAAVHVYEGKGKQMTLNQTVAKLLASGYKAGRK